MLSCSQCTIGLPSLHFPSLICDIPSVSVCNPPFSAHLALAVKQQDCHLSTQKWVLSRPRVQHGTWPDGQAMSVWFLPVPDDWHRALLTCGQVLLFQLHALRPVCPRRGWRLRPLWSAGAHQVPPQAGQVHIAGEGQQAHCQGGPWVAPLAEHLLSLLGPARHA